MLGALEQLAVELRERVERVAEQLWPAARSV